MSDEKMDAILEAVEHIVYLCKDVPDELAAIPEAKHLSELRSIKKVANQALKCAENKTGFLTDLLNWARLEGVQVAQYGTWFGTYIGEKRPLGSDGCISYEQSFLEALKQARSNAKS